MKEIKQGSYVIVDGSPCRVVEMEVSSPGKHGHAKVRMTAIGIFDGSKHIVLKPIDGDMEIPDIKKKRAQVVSMSGETVQLMDLDSYEMYEAAIPEEFKDSIKAGSEVEVLETMHKVAITRIVGGK